MGTDPDLQLVSDLVDALGAGDGQRAGRLYADDAVVRMAGVPRALGGVVEGRAAIIDDIIRRPVSKLELRLCFGGAQHLCAVVRRQSTLAPTNTFQGNEQPFTTYECIVLRVQDGTVKEQTTYVNWLDAYVQAGMVDLADLVE